MLAVLIPVTDFVHFAPIDGSKDTYLTLNSNMLNRIRSLLMQKGVKLFILINQLEHDNQLISSTDGSSYYVPWKETLAADCAQLLTRFFNKSYPFFSSADLSSEDFIRFAPQQKAWCDESYTQKILVTQVSPLPEEDLIQSHNLLHFRLHGSIVSPTLESLKNKFLEANKDKSMEKMIIALDNDDTMLDVFSSRLRQETVINTEIIEIAKTFNQLAEETGLAVRCLSITSRERKKEMKARAIEDCISMTAIAAAVLEMGLKVEIEDDLLSFSYPVWEGELVPKLKHLITAMGEKLRNTLIMLFDDSFAELNSALIREVETLMQPYNCKLIAVPVKRDCFNQQDNDTLTQILTTYVPNTNLFAPRLFARFVEEEDDCLTREHSGSSSSDDEYRSCTL